MNETIVKEWEKHLSDLKVYQQRILPEEIKQKLEEEILYIENKIKELK